MRVISVNSGLVVVCVLSICVSCGFINQINSNLALRRYLTTSKGRNQLDLQNFSPKLYNVIVKHKNKQGTVLEKQGSNQELDPMRIWI